MRQFNAFFKKEITELVRTGRLLLLGILFCIFGMMNPIIAKLTPELLKLASKDMGEMGIAFKDVTVNADASWTQFFKNMPMMLMVFTVLFGSVITKEIQNGTLINVLTKGVKRRKIIGAKTCIMFTAWTVGCALSFGITYGYNAYFWGNEGMKKITLAAVCFCIFGLWILSVIPLASAVFDSASAVVFSAGGAYVLSYALSFIPKIKKYIPTRLLDSAGIISGGAKQKELAAVIAICCFLIVINFVFSAVIFNKKRI